MKTDKPKDQKDKRRGSFYWLDNEPFVSVTNVIKILDKPALRYWYGKQVYLTMVKDPTLSEAEALSAPYQTTRQAASRGTTIHSVVEAYKKSGIIIDTIPDEFRGYVIAFCEWIKDNGVDIIENEKTVISRIYRYAGTLDLIVEKAGTGKWILDVKTGKDIYLESHLQLSAYRHALEEDANIKIQNMGVLLLQETGKYKFEQVNDCFEVFLAAKQIWEFLNKEDCKKVGYLKEA